MSMKRNGALVLQKAIIGMFTYEASVMGYSYETLIILNNFVYCLLLDYQ